MFLLKKVKYKHIKDINDLNIKKYKVTRIVGESGSGKSILLRLLNKLISCDSGEIFYNGQPLNTKKCCNAATASIDLPWDCQ